MHDFNAALKEGIMTNKIRFSSILASFIFTAALTGCSQDLCRDDQGNQIECGSTYNPDGGITPDGSVTPDGGTSDTFEVTGTIDSSWGTISKVDMVTENLSVITAACTLTNIENGHIRFSCTGPVQPANKFLVRFYVGSSTFAAVTNYPGSTPTTSCALAHGVVLFSVKEGSETFGWSVYSTNPGVADPANPCRFSY